MASPVTIQPSTADTFLGEAAGISVYGATNILQIGALSDSAARRHTLLSFNFSAVVPAGATITLATLSLYVVDYYAGRTIACYRLRRTDWAEASACWKYYTGTTGWSTDGALDTTTDHDTTNGATSASLSDVGWQNWTVTAQVQYAYASVAGVAHFFLKDTGASANAVQQYYSKEYTGNNSLLPKLYIEYTLPGPALLKTANGLAVASVKTRNGLAIASIKTWNGLA